LHGFQTPFKLNSIENNKIYFICNLRIILGLIFAQLLLRYSISNFSSQEIESILAA